MKEVIVPADDLVCLGKEKLQEVIRCKDYRYYDANAKSMATLCTRKQGCRETIPEGFCGWAVPKMDEVKCEID